MFIEINLVGNSNQIFTNYFEFKARKRVQVDNDTSALLEVAKFISENISTIDAALIDKGLVSRLQILENFGISDYQSLRYLLAQSGLDILTYIVAEQEVNPNIVDRGLLEYNIVDSGFPEDSFLPRATKIVVDSESSHMSDVYTKIQEIYGFFESTLFEGYKNPMKEQLDLIKETESLIGKAPEGSTFFINSILDYFDKRIILIVNNNAI